MKNNIKENSPVIGIIAEYDPFHNGHALHIAKARSFFGDSGNSVPVVAILSSSFTQRGLPALVYKMARAEMAIANGINLVLELPFVYACGAGPEFAFGAINTLAATQFVTHLAFGVENISVFNTFNTSNNNIPNNISNNASCIFDRLLSILIQEPLSFKLNLKENLASGCSYPKALALALEQECPGGGVIVSSPNNALAISYIIQIQKIKMQNNKIFHDMIPIPVQREGVSHRDETSGFRTSESKYIVSAGAIRKTLSNGAFDLKNNLKQEGSWIKDAMPLSTLSILKKEYNNGRLFLDTNKLWDLLRGLFVRDSAGIRDFAGMNEGLENLFLKNYINANSYEDFIGRCVCARYTRGRLQRQAIRCLIGLDRWTAEALLRCGPPYIRVLAYDDLGRELLHKRKKIKKFPDLHGFSGLHGLTIPVITKLSAAPGKLGKATANIEFQASRLREILISDPNIPGSNVTNNMTREEKIIPLSY